MAPKTPPKGRTSIKGVRSKLSDDQRDGVTNSKKERIMKYYHEYTMQKTIDKYYGGLQPQQQKSKKRLIYKWLKQEEAIVNAVASQILLMWDDFSGHWTEAVQAYATSINVVLMKIPPGYTSVCQPADIAWMKPFKLRLRSLWVDHLQSELRSHQNRASGEKFKLKAPSRETLMEWLTTAWENLPVATIASGFNRLAIPTDKRELAAKDLQLYDMEIDGLVGKLEALHVAEDVGVDFGLHV